MTRLILLTLDWPLLLFVDLFNTKLPIREGRDVPLFSREVLTPCLLGSPFQPFPHNTTPSDTPLVIPPVTVHRSFPLRSLRRILLRFPVPVILPYRISVSFSVWRSTGRNLRSPPPQTLSLPPQMFLHPSHLLLNLIQYLSFFSGPWYKDPLQLYLLILLLNRILFYKKVSNLYPTILPLWLLPWSVRTFRWLLPTRHCTGTVFVLEEIGGVTKELCPERLRMYFRLNERIRVYRDSRLGPKPGSLSQISRVRDPEIRRGNSFRPLPLVCTFSLQSRWEGSIECLT